MDRPPGVPAEFDVRTVLFLRRGDNPPDLPDDESTALHHAHLAYLSGLAERGIIAANGPMLDHTDENLRGMSIYTVGREQALEYANGDPAVRAGRFRVEAGRWWTAAGKIDFPLYGKAVGDRIKYEDMQ